VSAFAIDVERAAPTWRAPGARRSLGKCATGEGAAPCAVPDAFEQRPEVARRRARVVVIEAWKAARRARGRSIAGAWISRFADPEVAGEAGQPPAAGSR
jgi:hypothetical protein